MSIRAKTLRASCLLLAAVPLVGLLRLQTAQGDEDGKFDPTGWETKADYPAIGDARAKRDCKDPFIVLWSSFPPTLRAEGPNSNIVSTRNLHSLIYESLTQVHPETEEVIPCLATHWKRELDKAKGTQTFWFHINPKARFSDGSEVTAEDVRASWWHVTQEDRNDPNYLMTYKRIEEPEVIDKHTVKMKTKELNWQLFLDAGGMRIYPAKEIKIPGAQYLKDYDWKFVTGSGPYIMKPEDLNKGESITLTRRNDWWAENEPWAKNTNNFAQVKASIVRDEDMEYQTFKKGEVNHYIVRRATKWVEEIPKEDIVKKGWAKRRKIFHKGPCPWNGLAMNMREKPFDDKRVRLAVCYLFDREELMKSIFLKQYLYSNSYQPGRDWGNEDENEIITYDPAKAAKLLAEAGYKERGADGILIGPDGKRFELTLEYQQSPSLDRIFLVVQSGLKKGGIDLQLNYVDQSTIFKKIGKYQFKITFQSWGGGWLPNWESMWKSELADQEDNNNICGLKDPKIDALCDKFNQTFDLAEQKRLSREIDQLVYEHHPYALGWFAPYERILYWDKFGHPDSYVTKIVEDPERDMMMLWWYDTDRMKALATARAAGETLGAGDVEADVDVKPWDKKKK
jgi:microcin C transport system substrate-binding protein